MISSTLHKRKMLCQMAMLGETYSFLSCFTEKSSPLGFLCFFEKSRQMRRSISCLSASIHFLKAIAFVKYCMKGSSILHMERFFDVVVVVILSCFLAVSGRDGKSWALESSFPFILFISFHASLLSILVVIRYYSPGLLSLILSCCFSLIFHPLPLR